MHTQFYGGKNRLGVIENEFRERINAFSPHNSNAFGYRVENAMPNERVDSSAVNWQFEIYFPPSRCLPIRLRTSNTTDLITVDIDVDKKSRFSADEHVRVDCLTLGTSESMTFFFKIGFLNNFQRIGFHSVVFVNACFFTICILFHCTLT